MSNSIRYKYIEAYRLTTQKVNKKKSLAYKVHMSEAN